MSKLEDDGAFTVELSEDKSKIVFTEACDRCLTSELNRDELVALIFKLKKYYNEMVVPDL